ncbi:penicillin-binding protein [Mangrovibacter phragmitis]|uniref:Penicillin-binding protein activator LpoA n=1 Tax=Mangrovibacter phragmitis TaxID=1691903 RepID=A0A1B7KZQ6_9ENTR|nr:penicillin-binding protein activator [Mangrovibacter phragmitis]OAT75547.1 penicillin-binding protein [Mangrovibacter phragmitis]
MVPSNRFRSKASRSLPVVLAAILFAGCVAHEPDQSAPYMQGQVKAGSAFYLQQMQQSTNDTKTNWQLLAIRSLLQEGKTNQAVQLFQELPQQVTAQQRDEQALLAVEMKLVQQDPDSAKTLLANINPETLTPSQAQRYWQAQIALNHGTPSIELLRALIAQEPGLQGKAKQQNIDATWQALSSMTREQANALVINTGEQTLRGWLDLQHMWFDNRNDATMLQAAIKDWQTRYPDNPAAKMLPTPLANVQSFQPTSVQKIALLLPLSGQAAIFGRTIEQGFEAAKNAGTTPVTQIAPQSVPASASNTEANGVQTTPGTTADTAASANGGVVSPSAASVDNLTGETATATQTGTTATTDTTTPDTPVVASTTPSADTQAINSTPANPSAELKVYDTSAQSIDQIMAQVQKDGASIIIGPLLKENVKAAVKINTTLNMLALNQPEDVQNQANVCYFALSPENEAADAARHIWQSGQRNPLVLIPRNSFGSRISKAFATAWQQLGGGVVLEQQFGSVNELKMSINRNSGITLTGRPVQASLPQQKSVTIGGLTIPAAPSDADITAGTSGKVDAVYIVATQPELALLKPMITMGSGSRNGGAVLYASSRSAQGGTGPDFRLEMSGLQFSDIPMLSGGNNTLMQQALGSVNNDYSLARLYAMGVDAWTLASHFSQIRQVPGYQVMGNTGNLTANSDCVIKRKLPWLMYQQGNVVPVN